jgi:transaldolase
VQRPLWASTGVKNPDYRDTMYLTDLAVPNTVNTMPEKTMQAFADHGEVEGDQVTTKYAEAHQVMDDLSRIGIDYDDVIEVLENEGVEKFAKSWDELTATVEDQMKGAK